MSGSAVRQGAAGVVRRPCSGSFRRPYSSLLLQPVLLLLLAASPAPPVLAVDMNQAHVMALIEMRVALGVTGMQWWRTNGKVVCGAWIGVECDTKGNVVSVTAYNTMITPGLLPNSFTKLKTLTYLDLSSNRLNASLDQFARPLLHLPNLRESEQQQALGLCALLPAAEGLTRTHLLLLIRSCLRPPPPLPRHQESEQQALGLCALLPAAAALTRSFPLFLMSPPLHLPLPLHLPPPLHLPSPFTSPSPSSRSPGV
ncbi:unnamed protein product [Closterium sp. Yama58-4]|nr:unnamed protein product [Closterium sp. Yama58-4]